MFNKNVLPTYARYDLALSHGEGSYVFDVAGKRYLDLGGRPDLAARVLAEYDLTRRLVLAVTEHDRLVADRPVLSRAIVLRDPYVDALSYLQLSALTELRSADVPPADREHLERLVLLTVSGVAAGLQNTG